MSSTSHAETVNFGSKGQVVIPRRFRKEFEIEEGPRAQVYVENDHLVLKPITAAHFRKLRGSLKGKGVLKGMLAERKRERDL